MGCRVSPGKVAGWDRAASNRLTFVKAHRYRGLVGLAGGTPHTDFKLMKSPCFSNGFFRARSARLASRVLIMASLGSLTASAEWQPVKDAMMTAWGRELKADSVWQEYPRPQLERADWTNLNGLWDYAVTSNEAQEPGSWAGRILVPFCPESALSGVGRLIEPKEALWYKRPLPGLKAGKRTLLNFEAVDYTTTVWVNGIKIGSHTGGFTPFSFDITPALKAEGNELLVRVDDATEGFQLHGKQKLKNEGIWYTRVSGIWQTVWLENVTERFIRDLDFTPRYQNRPGEDRA